MGFSLARWGCVLSAVALLLVWSVGCGSDDSARSTNALSRPSSAKTAAPSATLPGTHGVIVMDDFESGSLTGWKAVGGGSGGWFVYTDGGRAPDPARSDPNAPFDLPDPPGGRFAAVADSDGPGTRILYRDEFEPGSQWAYSNYGFILLGVVIERVTGQSYYDYVQQHIYAPAGMTRSGSLPENQAVPGRSIGYTKPSATTARVPNTDTLPYRGTSAGGGYSTVEDLARFARALLSHKLLVPDATKLLISGKVNAGRGARYAYGFDDTRNADGNGWVGHSGGAPGMNGDLRIYPKSGYVVAVLANLDPPAAQRISEYLDPRLPTAR